MESVVTVDRQPDGVIVLTVESEGVAVAVDVTQEQWREIVEAAEA